MAQGCPCSPQVTSSGCLHVLRVSPQPWIQAGLFPSRGSLGYPPRASLPPCWETGCRGLCWRALGAVVASGDAAVLSHGVGRLRWGLGAAELPRGRLQSETPSLYPPPLIWRPAPLTQHQVPSLQRPAPPEHPSPAPWAAAVPLGIQGLWPLFLGLPKSRPAVSSRVSPSAGGVGTVAAGARFGKGALKIPLGITGWAGGGGRARL